MNTEKSREGETLSQEEIDRQVAADADTEDAWEAPVRVKPTAPTSFKLPSDLAARAAFLARLHHRKGLEDWLTHVIRERVELEEVAFAEAKRDLAVRSSL